MSKRERGVTGASKNALRSMIEKDQAERAEIAQRTIVRLMRNAHEAKKVSEAKRGKKYSCNVEDKARVKKIRYDKNGQKVATIRREERLAVRSEKKSELSCECNVHK